MKRNIKKQNNSKKILFIAIIILILLASIIILTKTEKNNKINNIKQESLGLNTTNIGDTPFDITNQVTKTPNKPVLSAGMIPVKYKNGNWCITTEDDPEWYNYEFGNMANIMLNDGYYKSEMGAGIKENQLSSNAVRNETNVVPPDKLGTIFTWIPKFAYNENHEVLYLKAVSSIAGNYTTSEIFTYKASGVDKQDIALRGIWVEQNSTLGNVSTNMNSEENSYGFIANTKAEYIKLETNFINSINKDNETGIKNTENYRMILKVVDEKLTEPIMAELSAKGKRVTINITKADNGIKEIRYIDGTLLDDFNGTTATYAVEKPGINKFIIIDNIGNQRTYEINVISPEIYVSTNADNYVEFNGEKWYPSGTQVRIQYASNMSGMTGYYKQINGTVPTAVSWSSNGTSGYKDFTINETFKFNAKIENSMGEVLGEDEATIHIMPTDTAIPASYYNNNIGGIYPVKVTGRISANQRGEETYPYNTYIQNSAVHMGLIKEGETKVLYIKIVPSPQGGYIGSSRNGVTTTKGTSNVNGYIFVTEEGNEIKLPVINNISQKVEDNKVTVTVDARSENSDKTIEKYYYSIDSENISDYIESDSNKHIFENVQAYQNHTIRVYVKDTYGIISNVTTITTKTSNTLPNPTIEIVDEENIETIEYNGKAWYPYRTQIRINYAENMTNLTGQYKIINGTTGEESGWRNTSSATYQTSVNETTTYIAKLKDSTGIETDEVRFTIYIMPYTQGTMQDKYSDNIGAIYPVRVTGVNSGNVYGTDTYMWRSCIQISAMHMGLVKASETKNLFIKIVQSPEGGYKVTTRNGITPTVMYSNDNGYIFVTEDGVEIRSPKIESTVLTPGENTMTVTVGATTNVGTIEKYYYNIDNGTFIESNSNIYTFEGVETYKTHTISAYVKNNYGVISDTISLTGKTSNTLPTPTIEIVDEENIETVEYDGKIWYPYNTQIKINYAEDMTNLTGQYKKVFETTGVETGWGTTSSATYQPGLSESITYIARLVDSTGAESEEASIHLNIMASDTNLVNNYYTYGLNKIYPVRVKGYSSDTIWGTDTYTYDSRIRASAMHMGLVQYQETKDLFIKIVESPEGGYKASIKNGITSNTANSMNGYIFVTKDGKEIKSPTLNNLTTIGGENSITATVEINCTNAEIAEYYYAIIDDTTYKNNISSDKDYYKKNPTYLTFNKSTENSYEFTVEPYKNYRIIAYAKDTNGAISEFYDVVGKAGNEVPTPKIEIVDKDTLETVEYDGKTWYPYGTQIKVTYIDSESNDDMAKLGLSGYYKYKYDATNSESGWSQRYNNGTYYATETINIYESITYSFKNQDKLGEESEVASIHLNIMPSTTGLQSRYANYCLGQTFPVIVTGSTSGTIYGTEVYYYNSYIARAAMQMGLVQEGETKQLFIKVVENPNKYYKSATANGITSNEYFSNNRGYVFVDKNGNEIKLPIIENTTVQDLTESIEISINATAYNGATVNKYYYGIDDGAFVESNSNKYIFNTISRGTHIVKTYVKDTEGRVSIVKRDYVTFTGNNISWQGYSVVNHPGKYGFKLDGTSLIPENGSKGNKVNTTADAYIELNLSGSGVYKITVNAEVSSENNYDFGYATISKTTLTPSYDDSTGRFVYISGTVSEKDYSINVKGGEKYYLHFGYRKDGSGDGGSDIVRFNSIKVEETSDTNYSSVNAGTTGIDGGNIDDIINGADITISVPEGTTYVEYNGEKWYPYNTNVTIAYAGSGTRTHYYAYMNEVTDSPSGWSSNSTNATWSKNITESTTFFAKITDASNNIVTEKSIKINIMPQNTGMNSNYTNANSIGKIFPVEVTYSTSGNCYGTNIYRYDSNISKAASHMGLVKSGETKVVYAKMVSYPSGGYISTTKNGITTQANGSAYNGFVFVDENENEIKDNNYVLGEVGATLSGYNVINNNTNTTENNRYTFINDETSVIPTNSKVTDGRWITASSYIEIDLTDKNINEAYMITLNAEISAHNSNYGYATITENTTPPVYSDTNGRFVYIHGQNTAQDYTTILLGGKKYYLHLGYRKDGSIDTGSDIVKFNSLKVEKLADLPNPEITIDSSVTPIEYNGELWYPYGTRVYINYSEGYDKYSYKCEYEDGTTSSLNTSSIAGKTITCDRPMTIKAGYTSECSQSSLKINIMPYQYSISQAYYNNIGKIYPVQVTGRNSDTIYGTAKYTYDSSVAMAATHMGLVKQGETKTVYIKMIEFPQGGYKASRMNNITSKDYTTVKSGYVFVTEDGTEILEPIVYSNATLSGYNVYPNGTYCFEQLGDSISCSSPYNSKDSESYIELDLSKYSKEDMFKINLNMEISGYYYGCASITKTKDQTAYSNSTGRFIYVNATQEAKNYGTIIPGGEKYYLHLASYRYGSNSNGENKVKFNSLEVTQIPLDKKPTITIDENAVPIEYKGELWYPYGTKVTISYIEDDCIYTNISLDNKKYLLYKYKNEISGNESSYSTNNGNYSTTLSQTTTLLAKYGENYSEETLKINIMPANQNGGNRWYFNKVGNMYPVQVTGTTGGYAFGNNIYLYGYSWNNGTSAYTYISKAAVHMGLVDPNETKTVYIKIVQMPEGGYGTATKNNITSTYPKNYIDTPSNTMTRNGFVFVTEDGREIIEPIINSGTAVIGSENTIVATVNAVGNNEAKIEKYYYSIDNGGYIESTENTHTFTDIDAHKTHTVKIYVRDEFGAVSQTKEIVTSVVTNNVLPTITIDENAVPIEYNGELWYPSGTQLTINYAEDMTNLTAYYAFIDESTGNQGSWTNYSTNKTYTITLNSSVTYMAKIADSSGNETDVVRKTIRIMPDGPNGTSAYTPYIGNVYPVRVTGTTSGNAYGEDIYKYSSNVSKTATHMGLVNIDETEVVLIKIVPAPVGGYRGTLRNGVQTSNDSYTYSGYVFIDENGNEIIRPKVNSMVTTSGDNSITITVNAESKNATIEKYYYSIDNKEYVETTSNIHTFDEITTSGNHTIKIYVKDSNGDISSIKEIYGNINTPTPTFTFDEEPIEYNGEKWYPYGTRMYINYSTTDTGYYRYVNAHNGSKIGSWTKTSSYPYNTVLSESMIYEAYNYNSVSGESEHIRETINIMLNPTSLKANVYTSGNVYPVQVTGTTSGTLYGTDTYEYSSNINKAAMHAGLVKNGETKVVYIKVVPCPEGGYQGSKQNGVTSSSYTTTNIGFTFVQ